jgi:hypothetical protein
MDFTIAEDLATYSAEDLAAKITEGRAALDALLALDDPSDGDVAQAEQVAEALASLSAETTRRVTASADRASRMAALREMAADKPADKPVEEPEVEETEDDDDAGEDAPEHSPEGVPVETVPESTPTKTSTRATLARRVARPVTPVAEKRSSVTIIASADVPGFGAGTVMADLDRLTEGVLNRMQGFPPPPDHPIENAPLQRYPVARIKQEFSKDSITDGGNDQFVVDHAADEKRLPGNSLVASGGWCAPSETLYDLCGGESTEGLLSIAEIQVNRGGIRYTQGPKFSDIYTAVGFCQTEAEAIAGTPKPCYEVECPPFVEVRLEACGICIKAPLLTNAGYPELVSRVISGALVAHQFKMSNKVLGKIIADATPVVVGDVGGTAGNLLDTVEYLIENARFAYRLPRSATIEVILPHWAPAAIRADLALRNGVDLLSVTDAQISAYFSVRGANPQYVFGLSDLPAVPAGGWPAVAQILVYPAGTYVKGTTDVISLDAVYDAASLAQNMYTALFVEEGVLVAKRCYGAFKADVATCQAGISGAATNADCFSGTAA